MECSAGAKTSARGARTSCAGAITSPPAATTSPPGAPKTPRGATWSGKYANEPGFPSFKATVPLDRNRTSPASNPEVTSIAIRAPFDRDQRPPRSRSEAPSIEHDVPLGYGAPLGGDLSCFSREPEGLREGRAGGDRGGRRFRSRGWVTTNEGNSKENRGGPQV